MQTKTKIKCRCAECQEELCDPITQSNYCGYTIHTSCAKIHNAMHALAGHEHTYQSLWYLPITTLEDFEQIFGSPPGKLHNKFGLFLRVGNLGNDCKPTSES